MESRTLISGCSSNSRISLIGRSEKSIDLSLVRSQKLVFLKTQNFSKLDLKWVGARRGVECRSSVERVEGVVGVEGFESESSVGLRRKKLGVFVSGGGSNFRSIHDGTVGGSVHGDVAVVVTNNPECGGAEYARGKGIPVIVFLKGSNSSDCVSAADLVDALREYGEKLMSHTMKLWEMIIDKAKEINNNIRESIWFHVWEVNYGGDFPCKTIIRKI